MDDRAEGVAAGRLDDNMDVIGHDAPGKEAVAFAVEVKDRILDCLCD